LKQEISFKSLDIAVVRNLRGSFIKIYESDIWGSPNENHEVIEICFATF
jgi:hypothetical protein